MVDSTNIILSICISIFIYLLLDIIDNRKQQGDLYQIKRTPSKYYFYNSNL